MEEAIKNMKTWEEAENYLARHGFGLGLIEQQKELWFAKPKEAPKPAAKPVEKPAARTSVTDKIQKIKTDGNA